MQVSNVSFQGKKEVLRGLNKAVKSAYNAEISRSYSFGPRPEYRGPMVEKFKGKLEAYTDMAVNDDMFLPVIKEVENNKMVMSDFVQNLRSKRLNYGDISPINLFSRAMTESAEGTLNENVQKAVKSFLSKLKEY